MTSTRGAPDTILDALVKTILSQNTTDVQSSKGFALLKARFGTWDAVRTADPRTIEAEIRSCGLAEVKTARIQNILETLTRERGCARSSSLCTPSRADRGARAARRASSTCERWARRRSRLS